MKLSFLTVFFLFSFYILSIKTEKYQSNANIMIKDLSQEQSISAIGSMLLGQTSSTMQDSELLKLYISSEGMFHALDKKHSLKKYYISKQIDFVQRLSKHAWIPYFQANQENLLRSYQNDLTVFYDEPSGTLNIMFMHANTDVAQAIVKDIIRYSTEALNRYEKENARVALASIKEQEKENKGLFNESIQKLILYQNKHNTIDPNIDVQSKSTILASLESELIKKDVEYKSKLGYLNKNAAEMQLIQDTIHEMKLSIDIVRKEIAGDGTNKLNKNVSKFELLKSEVEFNKERYVQALVKLEETKVSVKQNAKNLIVITKPTLAETYTQPNKLKDILTLLIVLSFLYGIFNLTFTLLNEHKD